MCKRIATLCYIAILCAALFFLPALPAPGQDRRPAAISQRGINEMAANVEQARRALIEDAGLRHPGEDLSAYLRRIALPLPGELKAHYFARINGYITVAAQSADATRAGRRLPPLRDTSAANQAQWERATRALQILPVRVHKMQAVWQRVQIMYGLAGAAPAPVLLKFDAQLEQTAQVIIAASDSLRDARP